MKIIGLTDIHGDTAAIFKITSITPEADVVLLVGDITNFGRRAETESVLSAIGPYKGKMLAVSGNCDYPEVDACLSDRDINLHSGCVVVDGIGFIGLGGSLITPFGTPNEISEEAIEACLNEAHARLEPDRPFVLVAHQPPHATKCDRLSSGLHVGSHAVREFIESRRPLVCFTGHIHESVGTDRIGEIPIINAGPLGRGFYAYAEINPRGAKVEVRPI